MTHHADPKPPTQVPENLRDDVGKHEESDFNDGAEEEDLDEDADDMDEDDDE